MDGGKLDDCRYLGFTQEAPFDFAKRSSIGCGGRAKTAFFPQSVGELTALVQALEEDKIPYTVLGNLTNVLPPDGGWEGVIICTKRLREIIPEACIFAYAGVSGNEFCQFVKNERLGGAEFLKGIPCTIGGALYMNAGAGGKYISEIVESVLVLREGKPLRIPLLDCGYDYKKSAFMQSKDIILGGYFRLQKAERREIEEEEERYLLRRKHLPKGKSMGCVFKNPEGGFAGALIEGSGLKGLRVGGAAVSTEHANFIINDRGATSADIRALITMIKNAVRSQYGVDLEEEIRYL